MIQVLNYILFIFAIRTKRNKEISLNFFSLLQFISIEKKDDYVIEKKKKSTVDSAPFYSILIKSQAHGNTPKTAFLLLGTQSHEEYWPRTPINHCNLR